MKNFWLQPHVIVAYAVSLLALAEIVDLTIVAVSLPQIMGALGANIDSIAMITTGYIVAAAVSIPLSGLVIRRYGMRNVTLVSGALFCVASILCGASTTLNEMVIFRILQGIGGAFLPAIAQSYISSTFKGDERSKMMTIYSLVIVMGPIIGPVMGGILTENLSWRWIFYVNVPICVVGIGMILKYMKKDIIDSYVKIDYISFAFMAIGIGCLEYFIDEGNSHGWFSSFEMIILFTIALILLGFFIWRGLTASCVVNLKIFKNMNFTLSCAGIFIFVFLLSGSLAYFPTMLQQSFGYPVDLAGYISAPRGMAAIVIAPFMPALMKRFGPSVICFFGIMIFAMSAFMLSSFSPVTSKAYIIIVVIIQGVGMIGFFIPIMQAVFNGISDDMHSDASGIFNFFRNFASSVGTSFAATLISHQIQVSYHDLGSHVNQYANGLKYWSQNIASVPMPEKLAIAHQTVVSQASFISFIDIYKVVGISMLCLLVFPFLIKITSKIKYT